MAKKPEEMPAKLVKALGKEVCNALSGIMATVESAASRIAKASNESASVAKQRETSHHEMIKIFHECGKAAQPLLVKTNPKIRENLLSDFMRAVYTHALGTAREIGKQFHRDSLARGDVPNRSQMEMGKSACKNVHNKTHHMENFTECLLSDDHRDHALAMAMPFTGARGEPTYQERVAVFRHPKRERILASKVTENVGLVAPYTASALIYRITQPLNDLTQRTEGKFTYADLSFGAGENREDFEVRLDQMPIGELYLRLKRDISDPITERVAGAGRYYARTHASVRAIEEDFALVSTLLFYDSDLYSDSREVPKDLPSEADEPDGPPQCPKCGSGMVDRNGPHGRFWGCKRFPDCRGTRPIDRVP